MFQCFSCPYMLLGAFSQEEGRKEGRTKWTCRPACSYLAAGNNTELKIETSLESLKLHQYYDISHHYVTEDSKVVEAYLHNDHKRCTLLFRGLGTYTF